ncbi:MAG TPA: hypothetical protein VEW04_02845 [Allosphingosinicella sp.]|nr:hypothetical protein [Allosphingosinicella sp.]
MSGWFFLGLGVFAALVDFFVGLRFTRMTADQIAPAPDGSVRSTEGTHRAGRILMLAAPVVFLIFAAIAFGVIPDTGIEPISFN